MAGVLRVPEARRRAVVYLRDSDECLPSKVKREVEAERGNNNEAAVAQLRRQVEQTPGVVCRHYTDPNAIADQIVDDLVAVIERDFPTRVFEDQFEEEEFSHTAFARARVGSFVLTAPLQAFVRKLLASETGQQVMVLAPSGAGKSSLMSHIVHELGRRTDALCHFHFIGQTTHRQAVDACVCVCVRERERECVLVCV